MVVRYNIRTVTPLDEVPLVISLAEAKAHLRVDVDDEDDLITAYLRAAQDHVERHTSRILTVREMEYACAGFPSGAAAAISIPREPITAVTAIAYLDGDGVAAALAADAWRWSESAPDQVMPVFGESWPMAAAEAGSVRITFEAGYEDGLCPASLVAAVKLMLGALYGNRENVVTGVSVAELPGGVTALCAPYRRVSI